MECGIQLINTLIFCGIIGNLILKPIFKRNRPFSINPIIELIIAAPNDFSFPSGHTMVSFASSYIIYKFNKKLGICSYILSLLIGISRMYLYVHYPTDVIAGAIIGILIGILANKIYEYICNKQKKEQM